MQVRNLGLLIVCQLISTSGSIVMVMLGGIIGSQLAANKALATLPLSMMVIAVAATTYPAAMLMKRIGRRKGCTLASLSAVVAMLLTIHALRESSFPTFVAAASLFGINMAFTQQYRYFAAESVATQHVPRAISLILIGSIGAAFVGKELATRGQFWIADTPYAGTLAVLAVLFVVQSLLFFAMEPVAVETLRADSGAERPIGAIARHPVFIVAVLGATAGYGIMTLVMTATPLSMHMAHGFSLQEVASVIQIHVLGMYAPSLFAGFLIERVGVTRLMIVGASGLLATSLIGLQGETMLHYWWGLLLLGLGWNFLFIGGTTMLTYTYSSAERFRAQGVNDLLVFGMSATASLAAGSVLHFFGWNTLMLIPIPILIIISTAIILVRNNPLLNAKGRVNA